MGQGILRNMGVYPGTYIPEPGAVFQIYDTGATERQAPEGKKDTIGQRGGIKTGDAGSLRILIGTRDGGFGEDFHHWVGTEM